MPELDLFSRPFSDREMAAAKKDVLSDRLRGIRNAARRGAMPKARPAPKRANRGRPIENPVELSPNQVMDAMTVGAPAVPFDSDGNRVTTYTAPSPLGRQEDEPGAVTPLTEEVFGDSTVLRSFSVAMDPAARDSRAFTEASLSDKLTHPSSAIKVQDARNEKHWSIATLAAKSGVEVSAIEAAELGEAPSDDDAAALADALNLEPDGLFAYAAGIR